MGAKEVHQKFRKMDLLENIERGNLGRQIDNQAIFLQLRKGDFLPAARVVHSKSSNSCLCTILTSCYQVAAIS